MKQEARLYSKNDLRDEMLNGPARNHDIAVLYFALPFDIALSP